MCQWKGWSLESVQEFAFRKGFDARNVKPSQGEIWTRLLCLCKEGENETRKNCCSWWLVQDLLPSLVFCVVFCRPFPWCGWRVFPAQALRKDWLLPGTDWVQAEGKGCAESWHRHAFCRIRKGNVPTVLGTATVRAWGSEHPNTLVPTGVSAEVSYISWPCPASRDGETLSSCPSNTCQLVTALLEGRSKWCCFYNPTVGRTWSTQQNGAA